MTNSIFQAELENLYIRKDAAYKDVTEAARTAMHGLVDRLESIENPPESIQQKMLELALELLTVGGKKQYGYLKKPLKDMLNRFLCLIGLPRDSFRAVQIFQKYGLQF